VESVIFGGCKSYCGRSLSDFLSHVLQTKVEVDAHSLILILEIVTAVLVVGLKPDLHGLVIPRSWLFTLAQRHAWPSYKVMAFMGHLINPLMTLVSDIQVGSGAR
jgi:hypothetical protein